MKKTKQIIIAAILLICVLLLAMVYSGLFYDFDVTKVGVSGWISTAENIEISSLRIPQIVLIIFMLLSGLISVCGKKWSYYFVIIAGLSIFTIELIIKVRRGYVMEGSVLTFYGACFLEVVYTAVGIYGCFAEKRTTNRNVQSFFQILS